MGMAAASAPLLVPWRPGTVGPVATTLVSAWLRPSGQGTQGNGVEKMFSISEFPQKGKFATLVDNLKIHLNALS